MLEVMQLMATVADADATLKDIKIFSILCVVYTTIAHKDKYLCVRDY